MLKIDFFFCFMCLIIYQASWYFVTVKVDAKNMVWLFRHEIIKLVLRAYSDVSDQVFLQLYKWGVDLYTSSTYTQVNTVVWLLHAEALPATFFASTLAVAKYQLAW